MYTTYMHCMLELRWSVLLHAPVRTYIRLYMCVHQRVSQYTCVEGVLVRYAEVAYMGRTLSVKLPPNFKHTEGGLDD